MTKRLVCLVSTLLPTVVATFCVIGIIQSGFGAIGHGANGNGAAVFCASHDSADLDRQELTRNGSKFCEITEEGEVWIRGSKVGDITEDGEVWVGGTKEGELTEDGEVWKNGVNVGEITDDLEIWLGGEEVGEIEPDGDVWLEGTCVGTTKGGDPRRAAIIFFFEFYELDQATPYLIDCPNAALSFLAALRV